MLYDQNHGGWHRVKEHTWDCEKLSEPSGGQGSHDENDDDDDDAPYSGGGGEGGQSLGSSQSAKMTMWSLHSDVIVGSNIAHEGGPSSCKFADPKNGGLSSPAATSPYIRTRMYCAADINSLYDHGKACGS